MRVERVITARSLWLGDLTRMNPRGRDLIKLVSPILSEWYGFQAPQPPYDLDKAGVEFLWGEFVPDGESEPIGLDVRMFNDGVVATCTTSTDHTDEFLGGTLNRLTGLGVIQFDERIIRKKAYVSEVIVQLDVSLDLPRFDEVAGLLGRLDGENSRYALHGIEFRPRTPAPGGPERSFSIARQIDAASSDMYFSRSQLRTLEHLEALKAFEGGISAPHKTEK